MSEDQTAPGALQTDKNTAQKASFVRMKVINIALKRSDGMVETDTVFAERMLTLDDAKSISAKYGCDVLLCAVGEFTPYDEAAQKGQSVLYKREVKDADQKE